MCGHRVDLPHIGGTHAPAKPRLADPSVPEGGSHLRLRFVCMSREGCVHIHFRTHHSRWLRSSGMSGYNCLSVCLWEGRDRVV